jgi:hypothetical protein
MDRGRLNASTGYRRPSSTSIRALCGEHRPPEIGRGAEPNGSVSTVRSSSYTAGGKAYLLPTVVGGTDAG